MTFSASVNTTENLGPESIPKLELQYPHVPRSFSGDPGQMTNNFLSIQIGQKMKIGNMQQPRGVE